MQQLHVTIPWNRQQLHVTVPCNMQQLHVIIPCNMQQLHVTVPCNMQQLHVTVPTQGNMQCCMLHGTVQKLSPDGSAELNDCLHALNTQLDLSITCVGFLGSREVAVVH